jgi:hypothetical protein
MARRIPALAAPYAASASPSGTNWLGQTKPIQGSLTAKGVAPAADVTEFISDSGVPRARAEGKWLAPRAPSVPARH